MFRKVVVLCCTVAWGYSAQGIAAETVNQGRIIDSYTTIESTGETLSHRTIELPNLKTGEPEIVTQVLRKNKDGSYSTVPTMISDKLKRRHEEICAQMGGKDVTNEGVATISSNMIDTYQCDLPVKEDSKTQAPQDGKSSESITSDKAERAATGTGIITRITGTGIVRTYPGATILQTAAYEVNWFRGGTTVTYSIQMDFCRYSGRQVYGGDSGSGRRAWGGRCLILRGDVPSEGKTFRSTARACTSSGSCKTADGAVIVEVN